MTLLYYVYVIKCDYAHRPAPTGLDGLLLRDMARNNCKRMKIVIAATNNFKVADEKHDVRES